MNDVASISDPLFYCVERVASEFNLISEVVHQSRFTAEESPCKVSSLVLCFISMTETISHFMTVTYAAALDGVSTAQQAVFLVLLFSSAKPIANSIAYIVGISSAYLLCGLIGLKYIDELNRLLRKLMPTLFEQPGPDYYQSQLILGVILTFLGVHFFKNRKKSADRTQAFFKKIATSFGPISAFVFGAFISSTSFPVAVPYISILEKIVAWRISPTMQRNVILYYNFIYILPTLIPFLIYWGWRHHDANIHENIQIHSERINSLMSLAMLAGVGIFFVIDSFWYIAFARPLLPPGIF